MSRLVTSEGLVLRSRHFSESSKIVTALTRSSGRVDLLARGARKPGSRFGAALEMGTEASFIFYERENKTLWTLSSADIINPNIELRETVEKLGLLARILKVIHHISHPGEVNPGIYNLTVALLNAMSRNPDEGLYELFLWRVTSISGYPPHIAPGCVVCGKKTQTHFSIPQGGLVCESHSSSENSVRLEPGEIKILKDLSEVSPSEVDFKLTPILRELVRSFARYHLHTDQRVIP